MKNKRKLTVLLDVRRKLGAGQITLDEAIGRFQQAKVGSPSKPIDQRAKLFLTVEAYKEAGYTTPEARKAAANVLSATVNVVKKAHLQGAKDFGPLLDLYRVEILQPYLDRVPKRKAAP